MTTGPKHVLFMFPYLRQFFFRWFSWRRVESNSVAGLAFSVYEGGREGERSTTQRSTAVPLCFWSFFFALYFFEPSACQSLSERTEREITSTENVHKGHPNKHTVQHSITPRFQFFFFAAQFPQTVGIGCAPDVSVRAAASTNKVCTNTQTSTVVPPPFFLLFIYLFIHLR